MASFTKLPDGRYRVRWDAPLDELGRRRQRSFTAPTLKAARAELRRRENETEQTGVVDASRTPLSTFLATWQRDHVAATLRPASQATYANLIRLYVVPHLGDLPLSQVTPARVQAWVARLVRQGLSPTTVQSAHLVLKAALGFAVKWNLIPRNPCAETSLPKQQEPEITVLDNDGMRRLLAVAKGTRYYTPILVSLGTGLRRGELLGLRWRDVDLAGGSLEVRQSLKHIGGKVEFGPPKTPSSRRAVTLGPDLVAALVQHKAAQSADRIALREAWVAHDLVFPALLGSPWSPCSFAAGVRSLARKAGLEGTAAKHLRHAHTTALLSAGVPVRAVAARLGHRDAATTLRNYTRPMPDDLRRAATATDEFLRQATDKRAEGDGDV